jgi:hypothetical protein
MSGGGSPPTYAGKHLVNQNNTVFSHLYLEWQNVALIQLQNDYK